MQAQANGLGAELRTAVGGPAGSIPVIAIVKRAKVTRIESAFGPKAQQFFQRRATPW